MRVCTELELAASLLRREVTLTVTTSGRHFCGAEWVVGPRTIDDHLMYYVVGPGAIRLRSGGQELRLPPETFFWLQPGVPHEFTLAKAVAATAGRGPRSTIAATEDHAPGGRASSRAEPVPQAEVVFFRFFLGTRRTPWRLGVPWVLRPLEPALGARLEELLPDHLPGGAARDLTRRYLLGALLARLTAQPAAGDGAGGLTPQQKEATLQFLRANLGRRVAVAEAARHAGLNADYFSRQFRRSFGVPPRAWITQARIQRAAAQLLETGQRVKQVAAALGYDDLYFFSRQFRQIMGKSPRKYRAGGDS